MDYFTVTVKFLTNEQQKHLARQVHTRHFQEIRCDWFKGRMPYYGCACFCPLNANHVHVWYRRWESFKVHYRIVAIGLYLFQYNVKILFKELGISHHSNCLVDFLLETLRTTENENNWIYSSYKIYWKWMVPTFYHMIIHRL